VNGCPGEGALELVRTKVLYEGDHTDLWDKIVEKLTTKRIS